MPDRDDQIREHVEKMHEGITQIVTALRGLAETAKEMATPAIENMVNRLKEETDKLKDKLDEK